MSCSLNSSNRGGGKEDCVSINRVDCVWMDILLGDDDDDTDSAAAEDDLNAETPYFINVVHSNDISKRSSIDDDNSILL